MAKTPTNDKWAMQALGTLVPWPVSNLSAFNIDKIASLLATDREGFFECHLALPGAIDFSIPVGVHNNQKELQWLAASFPLDAYIKNFVAGGTLYHADAIRNIWLEFDTSAPVCNAPAGVFFELAPAILQPDDYWQQLFEAIVPLTGTTYYTPANLAAALHCIQNINAGFAAHIGVMTGRNGQLRMCAKFAQPQAAYTYLQNTAGALPTNTLEKLTVLLQLADIAAVNYDFENGAVHPKFGVELHVSKHSDNHLYLEKLFAQLLAYGLCTAVQKNSLLQWPENENNYTADFMHTISHVKITVDNGIIQAAKVYLHYIYAE